ncbi:hypothetical protein D3C80_2125440 [compost metagenome]
MTPFALVRCRSGVISGIKATVGERNRLMERFISTMNKTRVGRLVYHGISVTNTAPRGMPISRYGIRRPYLVRVLSLR